LKIGRQSICGKKSKIIAILNFRYPLALSIATNMERKVPSSVRTKHTHTDTYKKKHTHTHVLARKNPLVRKPFAFYIEYNFV